ncbi:hypothetical protein [Erwinia psidii]|uniref:Uncharacterized protein n=1 Tax=Erwinia psidii TaxID=69224 RepID=A0A3N6RZC6_9GAMM|nr:hypothetical protein [Erwinia psidii]MCX8957942.1 hypothetical protein [Erwinia psidii]MCX8960993.1 hypothetical protein [Erwinia psidii]MCX8967126.1 hypothetical protein [Erwinia psidii]RQM38554.1 hypothetical protein EB241_10090 [Erwinia psidii]
MKNTIIALSVLLLASPVFADTINQATDAAVLEAHKGADTAKEKLHETEDQAAELKLKAQHAAEGESDSTTSKISEGSQKAWHKTKQLTEKTWDTTTRGVESLKNKVTE